jgi:hypothetical protein
MNEIVIKVDNLDEQVTLVLENFDPAQLAGDADVWLVTVLGEEGVRQIEYFEMDEGADSLDVISGAIHTIQNETN